MLLKSSPEPMGIDTDSAKRLLNRFFGVLVIAGVLMLLIGVPFLFPNKLASALACVAMLLVVAIAWRISWAGQPKRGLRLFAVLTWLVAVTGLYMGMTPIIFVYMMAVSVVYAIVVRLREAILFASAYLLAWLVFVLMSYAGTAPHPYFSQGVALPWFHSFIALWLVLLPLPDLVSNLRRAKVAAEAANMAKSVFLSNMSHELRTPLNAVMGFSQLLKTDPDANPEVKEHATEIYKAGAHLLALITDMLDLAKIEAGRMELRFEDVALAEILEDCRRMIEPFAKARDIAMEFPQVDVHLHADRVRLRQVLINLLSNAVKYNQVQGTVALAGEAVASGRYRISVSDTGPGIPAERFGELFERFNRLDAERSGIGGVGIGLVITRDLVELMSGAMGVTSVVGQGSTFWVELPLAAQG